MGRSGTGCIELLFSVDWLDFLHKGLFAGIWNNLEKVGAVLGGLSERLYELASHSDFFLGCTDHSKVNFKTASCWSRKTPRSQVQAVHNQWPNSGPELHEFTSRWSTSLESGVWLAVRQQPKWVPVSSKIKPSGSHCSHPRILLHYL